MLTSSLLTVSLLVDIWDLEIEFLRLFIFKLTNSKNFWVFVGIVRHLWGFFWNTTETTLKRLPRLTQANQRTHVYQRKQLTDSLTVIILTQKSLEQANLAMNILKKTITKLWWYYYDLHYLDEFPISSLFSGGMLCQIR